MKNKLSASAAWMVTLPGAVLGPLVATALWSGHLSGRDWTPMARVCVAPGTFTLVVHWSLLENRLSGGQALMGSISQLL